MVRWRRLAVGLVGVVGVGGFAVGYAIAEETRLFALDSQTGRVQWSIAQLPRGHHAPQVVGDLLVVSQSNYKSDPLFGLQPVTPNATGQACVRQGWGMMAYDTASGQERWVFCPNAQQFPQLDLRLTHGMQFQLTRDHVYIPLLMDQFLPGKQRVDQLLAIATTNGTPTWSVERDFHQSLAVDEQPYMLNGNLQVKKRKVTSELYGSSVVQAGQQVVLLTGRLQAPVTLQAFNAATGKPTWTQKIPDTLAAESQSSLDAVTRNYLLANRQQVFQVSPIDGIIALAAEMGKLQFQTKGEFWGRTLVTDSAFYQFEPTAVSAYSTTTGKRQWRWQYAIAATKNAANPTANPTKQPPEIYGLLGAVDPQRVYTHILQREQNQKTITVQVVALRRDNGQPQWHQQFELPEMVQVDVPPVGTASGVSLVVANPQTADPADLQLVRLDASTGAIRWRFPLHWTSADQSVVRVYGLMTGDADQVFIRDRAARFQHWLAARHLLR